MPFPNFLDGQAPIAPIDQMSGINSALAQNAARPAPRKGGGMNDILGAIGDALLIANGRAPLYAANKERQREFDHQEQINAALANYMDDPEGAIRALMGIDAQAGIQLLQGRQKDDRPALARDYDWYRGLPPEEQAKADAFIEKRKFNPYAAPMVLGPTDRIEGGGNQGGPAPGVVEDGYRFRGGNPGDPNNWEPVNGGQTPQASGGFPY